MPLGIQRIYALITYDVPKSVLRKSIEALSDELTSMISRLDNSLSFYIYLFAGGILFRQTLEKWFRRITGRARIAPVGGTIGATRIAVNRTNFIGFGVGVPQRFDITDVHN